MMCVTPVDRPEQASLARQELGHTQVAFAVVVVIIPIVVHITILIITLAVVAFVLIAVTCGAGGR